MSAAKKNKLTRPVSEDEHNSCESSVECKKAKKTIKTNASSDCHSVKKWMTDKKVDDVEYWKALAEERRVALENALKENENLVHENELLKAENAHLQQLADNGMKLAQLVSESVDQSVDHLFD
ncbi:Geminin-like protein [Dinothrombium tinctorium]|uniref:Geminin-like protein n=1 Tax=Dinothrombium tinctorium TaxID=1965070 RepID=A0A443R4Z8_9ACAR|nr:Geminin-like protein [Dinothrombium tinctorium]